MTDSVNLDFLRHQLAQAKAQSGYSEAEIGHAGGSGGGGPEMPDHGDERLGRLEGELSGLQHAQNMTLGGLGLIAALVAIVVAAVIGFGIYELQRIDQVGDRINTLNDKVNELPGKISADMRDLTKTLADTITAARQSVPPPVPPERKR